MKKINNRVWNFFNAIRGREDITKVLPAALTVYRVKKKGLNDYREIYEELRVESTRLGVYSLFDREDAAIHIYMDMPDELDWGFLLQRLSEVAGKTMDLSILPEALVRVMEGGFNRDPENVLIVEGEKFASTGTGTLGRSIVFSGVSGEKYMADSHVMVIEVNEQMLHPRFFQIFLSLPSSQDKIYTDCVNGSTNQIELSKESFGKMQVPIIDIELQKQFVEFANQSDKSKFELQDAIDNLDALSKKIIAENLIAAGVTLCHSLMKTIQLSSYLLIV